MATVADIMTRGVLSIPPTASVEALARGLERMGVHGAPVKDEQGRVYGMVSTSDLADPEKGGSWEGKTVSDIMTPVILAVNTGDPIDEVIQRMVDTGSHRLLVVDELEHPVGIVTPMDVLRAVVQGKLELRVVSRG